VRVAGVDPVRELEDHVVSVGLRERDRDLVVGDLVRQAVDRLDHRAGADRH
jgi:hypothetical protein